jgi:chitinase
MHYSSVISRRKNDRVYKTLSCPLTSRAKPARPWVRKWSADHNPDWYNGWMQSKSARCQADEYPPAAFWQGQTSPKQYIRFAPGSQNGGAGSLFGLSFCDFDDDGDLPQMRTSEVHDGSRVVGGLIRQITKYKAVTVRSQVVITFDAAVSNQGGNWGLSANPCWPSKLVNDDPGFALLTDDSYYQDAGHAVAKAYNHNYAGLIPQDILNSASAEGFSRLDGWRKRSLSSHMLDPDAWVVDQGNSTRAATDEELERELGILRCASADCRDEMVAFGIESAVVVVPSSLPYGASSAAVTAVASTTTVIESVVTSGVMTPSAGSGVDGLVNQRPRQTRS